MTKIRFFLLFVGILTIMKGFALPNVLPVDGLKRWSPIVEYYDYHGNIPYIQPSLSEKRIDEDIFRDFVRYYSGSDFAKDMHEHPDRISDLKIDTIGMEFLGNFQQKLIERISYKLTIQDSLFFEKKQEKVLGKRTDITLFVWLLIALVSTLIGWWVLLRASTRMSFWTLIHVTIYLICFLLQISLYWLQGWLWGVFALGTVMYVSVRAPSPELRQILKSSLKAFGQQCKDFFSEVLASYSDYMLLKPYKRRTEEENRETEDTETTQNKNKAENLHDCP